MASRAVVAAQAWQCWKVAWQGSDEGSQRGEVGGRKEAEACNKSRRKKEAEEQEKEAARTC